ncbi:MAG: tetratricopeptide repeat protein [Planctomycetes bacterium]|nr:tetratricopeptide repeat protein [Planctomycetota bacterium]
MHAETSYLFRHAILRDAAYELQMPGDRAKLHELAFLLIESAFDGPAPWAEPLESLAPLSHLPHPCDSVAHELVIHARLAGSTGGALMQERVRRYLQRGALHAQLAFDNRLAVALWKELAGELDSPANGEAMRRAGELAMKCGLTADAEVYLHEALKLQRESQTPSLEARCHLTLGRLYAARGKYKEAELAHRESLRITQSLGDTIAAGLDQSHIAGVYLETGRMTEAEDLFQMALSALPDQGSERNGVLPNLGILYAQTGRLEQARDLLGAAVTAFRTLGTPYQLGICLANLGTVRHNLGDTHGALGDLLGALEIHRQAGNRRFEAMVLGNLGNVYERLDDNRRALECLLAALNIYREIGDRRGEGVALGNHAIQLRLSGRSAESVFQFRQAIEIHRQVGNRRAEGGHTCDLAISLVADGEIEKAKELWRTGSRILHDLGDQAQMQKLIPSMQQVCARAGVPELDSI